MFEKAGWDPKQSGVFVEALVASVDDVSGWLFDCSMRGGRLVVPPSNTTMRAAHLCVRLRLTTNTTNTISQEITAKWWNSSRMQEHIEGILGKVCRDVCWMM